jgi:signal transduction histidine kinase
MTSDPGFNLLVELGKLTEQLKASQKRQQELEAELTDARKKLKKRETDLDTTVRLKKEIDDERMSALNETVKIRVEMNELASLKKELETRYEELRQVRQFAQRAAIQERRNIGRDVHSETLNGIDRVVREIRSMERPELYGIADELIRIRRETSRIMKRVHPDVLEANNFIPALETLASRCTKQDKIPCKFINMIGDDDFEPEDNYKKLEIYRIVQEAMNNLVKHSQAKSAEIRVSRLGSTLEIVVIDDGIGCGEDTMVRRREQRILEGGGQGSGDIEIWAKMIDADVHWKRRPRPDNGTTFTLVVNDCA